MNTRHYRSWPEMKKYLECPAVVMLSGRAEMSHFYWKPEKGDSITLEVSSNCDIILRSTRKPGDVEISASVPGLKGQTVKFRTSAKK